MKIDIQTASVEAVEVTDDMIEAGKEAARDWTDRYMDGAEFVDWDQALPDVFRRMLALASLAAPTQGMNATLASRADTERRGVRISFSEAEDGVGNAVISPDDDSDGPYWTLIGGGSNEEQNRIAAFIVESVNSRSSALTAPPSADLGDWDSLTMQQRAVVSAWNYLQSPSSYSADEERFVRVLLDEAHSQIRASLTAPKPRSAAHSWP